VNQMTKVKPGDAASGPGAREPSPTVSALRASPPIASDTLASAMAAAFGEIEGATKSANNPHFKTKYADITAVIEAIKPALIAHGLFFTQHPQPSENGITVETFLHHAGGESLSLGSLFVPANKNDAQGFGSALTYARRYALVTAFGVPVEDDDGNAAARGQSRGGAASPSQPIDDAQWACLVQLIEAAGVSAETVCTAAGAPSLRELPSDKFESVKKKLQKTIDTKRQQGDA
jgi:hypothetical protein